MNYCALCPCAGKSRAEKNSASKGVKAMGGDKLKLIAAELITPVRKS